MREPRVVGSFLAEELTSAGVLSMNAHKTIYIVTPEFNSNSQIVFKDNYRAMINGKNVLILTATVTTGLTINKAIEGASTMEELFRGSPQYSARLRMSMGFRSSRYSD